MHLNDLQIEDYIRAQIIEYVTKVDELSKISDKARRAYEKISLPLGILAILPYIFLGAAYFGNVDPIKNMVTIEIFVAICVVSTILFLIIYLKSMTCKAADTKFNDFFFGEVHGFLHKNQFRYVPPSFEYTFNARGKLTHIPTGVVCEYSPNMANNDNNMNMNNAA